MAQSVKRPTSAQGMISWFMSSNLASGSALIAQSLESFLDSVSPSPSAPPLLILILSLPPLKIDKTLKKKFFF